MKRFLAILLCVITLGSTVAFCAAADDFSATLALFPDSYKASLTALHKAHPNWVFKRVKVGKNFSECLNAEHNCRAQECTVMVSSATDSKACQANCKYAAYHYISDGTRCASYDYIAECMDPTNFLRESLIFQFEYLNAKSYYTTAKLETALDAAYSFMHNKTCTVSGKTYTYAQIILDACKANNVDALFIISRITNEVGALYPVKLARGYEYKGKTVYNFFSIGAYPTADADAPLNGAKTAYNKGWFNPKLALEGGIKFIAQNYIKAGQYTNYFQKYQVNPNCTYDFYTHQYMQGVEAISNESGYTFNHYNRLGILDSAHTFYLPVYENLSKVDYESQDLRFKNASFSDTFLYVNAQVSSSLAVRTKASTSEGSTTCRITRGTLLQKTGTSGLWYKVKVLNGTYKGTSGYVHGDYVNPAQKLTLTKGTGVTLKPKLRTSTCSYAAAYNTAAGAVGIKSGKANAFKIGYAVFKATSSAGNVGYLEVESVASLPAPTFRVSGGEQCAEISWNKVEDASFYRVYTYNSAKKSYDRLAETKSTSFTHKNLAQGTEYIYLVRAFDLNSNGSAYTAANNKAIVTRPPKPTYKLAPESTQVKVSWNKTKGAEQYGVWAYNAKTDSYTKLIYTQKLNYTISGLKANTKYTYLVRAYNKSGWSAFKRADNQSVVTAPALPKLTAKGGEKAVRLTWTKSAGAAFYRVYTYQESTGKYTRIAQTKALTYKQSGLAEGTKYTYLVRAFNSAEAGSTYSAKSNVAVWTIPTKPKVTAVAARDSVQFTWKAVKGADYYGIWRYDAQSGTYTKLINTQKTAYRIDALKPASTYYFLVRAHNASGWNLYTTKDNVNVVTLK